jgi:hypothetical protein
MTDENKTTSPDSGTTQEMVQVEFASDADLDAYMASQESADYSEPDTATESQSPSFQQDASEQDTYPQDQESNQEEGTKDVVTKADFEKVQRQLEGLEIVTKRHISKLADTRQTLAKFIEAKKAGLEDKMAANPVEGTNDLLAIREAAEKINEIDQETESVMSAQQNRSAVLQHIDLRETSIDDIAGAFVDDGIPMDVVEQFRRDPFSFPATTTIQAAKRVRAEKIVRQLVNYAKQQKSEIARLKGKGGDVMKRIEQTARNLPEVTANSGGAPAKQSGLPLNRPVEQWTTEEIDKYLSQAGR